MMLPLLISFFAAAAPTSISTVAERSQWQETGRYEEVTALCHIFPRRFPGRVRCERFGTTPEGRPMWVLTTGTAGAKPTVVLQGGIHAGEIDGKDAGFAVLRDILEGTLLPGVLDRLQLVFIPVLNVDGHERFGPNHRVNQVGPKEMGFRVTALNLNLNRDFTKADAPEMAALLRLLGKWDPILFVDLHVTNGAKFQPEVSLVLEPRLSGPEPLKAVGSALLRDVLKELADGGLLPLEFYPVFLKEDDPASGFSNGIAPPRLGHGYWPLRNRLTVLVEAHSWKDYGTRVKATRNTVVAILRQAMGKAAEWKKIAAEIDSQETLAVNDVPLAWDVTGTSRVLDFPGYEYTREPSEISGAPWVRYDDSKPQIWKVPYFEEVKVTHSVRLPEGGYVVPPAHSAWMAEKLRLHGFRFTTLAKAARDAGIEVEVFRAKTKAFRPTPFEGRTPLTVTGAWTLERRELPAGSLVVPSKQRGQRLLAALMEPLSKDSFLAWGFFNAHYEQKEYMEPYVAEEVARKMLAENPGLVAEFQAKVKADAAFAKDPLQRLNFFYRRHGAWDERMDLYPVFRVSTLP